MDKKISHKAEKGFNKSSKILAFKLGNNASIILSSLIYKYNYWLNNEKLIKIGSENYFYITYINLQAETLIKQSAIKKAITDLKKAGLINVKRKGLPATNHYSLNEETINNFELIHEDEYLRWIESLNSIAKTDRNRFNNSTKESISKPSTNSQIESIKETSQIEFIEQMRNSISSQTHISGL